LDGTAQLPGTTDENHKGIKLDEQSIASPASGIGKDRHGTSAG